jgi:hypothetical protein
MESKEKETQKKPYTPPTLVEYGTVEEKTRGMCSYAWVVYGSRMPPWGGGKGGDN